MLPDMTHDTDCPFCSIASGDIPAAIVYQDPSVVAFMDKNPINPGHVLVVPRVHEKDLQELSDDIYLKVCLAAKTLAKAIQATYSPKKVGFAVAGFDVPHAHLHVIPLHHYHDMTSRRYVKDGEFHRAGEGEGEKPTQEELEAHAARIERSIDSG